MRLPALKARLPGADHAAELWRSSALRRRYRGLEPRERRLLGLGAALVAAALLWTSVVRPALDYRQQAVTRLDRETASLAWMESNRSLAVARRNAGGGQQAQLSTINRSAGQHGIPLRRIQPDGEGFIVHVESRPFDALVRWMEALETRHGVRVVSVTVDPDGEGQVNARLTLR